MARLRARTGSGAMTPVGSVAASVLTRHLLDRLPPMPRRRSCLRSRTQLLLTVPGTGGTAPEAGVCYRTVLGRAAEPPSPHCEVWPRILYWCAHHSFGEVSQGSQTPP